MGIVIKKTINIALTSWEDRISPVFDAARTLLVAEIRNKEVTRRSIEQLNPEMFSHLAQLLSRLKIDVLICGAISEIPANIIESNGIELISFVGGNIEEVIESYIKGESIIPTFLMPGCGRRHRRSIRVKHSGDHIEMRSMPKREGSSPHGEDGCGKGNRGCANRYNKG